MEATCKRRALHACVTHKSITRATPKKLMGGVRWLGSFGSVVVEKYGLGELKRPRFVVASVCVCDRLQKSMISDTSPQALREEAPRDTPLNIEI